MNPYGYPDRVWQLFRETPNAGDLVGPGILGARAEAPAQNAILELQAEAANGTVRRATFRALGCPTTIAVGAWLAGQVAGKSAAEVAGISAAQIRAALQIPEDRTHCALLGEDLVRDLAGKMTP